MTRPLIVANWKMNPPTESSALGLARDIERGVAPFRSVAVVIAPPFPFLAAVRRVLKRTHLGAQNVFPAPGSASTGEVSPAMLRDLRVRYVIIGHSERRRVLGESDEIINQKLKACLKARLVPILAIGEALPDSQAVVPTVLFQQLSGALRGISKRELRGAVVAYEPVWAIGTGQADTPDNATRRAIYIRKLLTRLVGRRIADTIRVLYGGSVTAKNAAAFFNRDIRGMEGLLVGGASLRPAEFIQIVASVARCWEPHR